MRADLILIYIMREITDTAISFTRQWVAATAHSDSKSLLLPSPPTPLSAVKLILASRGIRRLRWGMR
jgi:hypothetical protein